MYFVSRIPGGDGSPAAPTVTAGITLSYPTETDPIPPPQVAQTLTATFTVTNQGGSTVVLKALTLLESDPSNAVPDFPPARNLVIEPGDSYRFSRGIVLDSNRDVQLQGGLSDCGQRLAEHSGG